MSIKIYGFFFFVFLQFSKRLIKKCFGRRHNSTSDLPPDVRSAFRFVELSLQFTPSTNKLQSASAIQPRISTTVDRVESVYLNASFRTHGAKCTANSVIVWRVKSCAETIHNICSRNNICHLVETFVEKKCFTEYFFILFLVQMFYLLRLIFVKKPELF